MNLRDYLTDSTNVIEIYFCPEKPLEDGLRIPCLWNVLPKINMRVFKCRVDQEFTEYTHRHLVHQYDLATDMQKTYTRSVVKDCIMNQCYIVSFQEDTLPMHRFPCTSEINDKKTFQRVTFKYNNRLSLVVEKEEEGYVLYIRYFHVDNIDIDKMNEDLVSVFGAISI